jgi:hypothetical protein
VLIRDLLLQAADLRPTLGHLAQISLLQAGGPRKPLARREPRAAGRPSQLLGCGAVQFIFGLTPT